MNNMKTLNQYMDEQLKNDEFRKEWENSQPELDVIRAIVDARTSQNLTQKELSERTGINQATKICTKTKVKIVICAF